MAFYLARQPIYDADLQVTGYELLFRGGACRHAEFTNGDQATWDVIASGVRHIGLDKLVGDHPAFINATDAFLRGDPPLPEHRDRIVLEVLENVHVDASLIERLNSLSENGYRIALDDFVYRPGCDRLLEVADFVKLDVQALTPEELVDHVARLRRFPVRLIAEKVEDYGMMCMCRELGFDMYQGFFFCRPSLIRGRRPEADRLEVMQLISRLQNPCASADELEPLISRDPMLSRRLLDYVNSARSAPGATVTSVRQALLMAGPDLVRSWATLLLMSRLTDSKPVELITTGLVRARMCELLGERHAQGGDGRYFSVGLLSVLDALLDMDMPEVVEALPLDDEIWEALSVGSGALGDVLTRVIDYERGRPAESDVSDGLGDIYVRSLTWALETQQAINA